MKTRRPRELPSATIPFTPPPRPPFDRIIQASALKLDVLPRLAEAAACLPWRYRVFVAGGVGGAGAADRVDLRRLAVVASLAPEAWFFVMVDGAAGGSTTGGGAGDSHPPAGSPSPAGSPALRLPSNLWLGARCHDTATAAAALDALAGFPPSRRFLVVAPLQEPVRLPTSPASSAGSPPAVQWIISLDGDPPHPWADRRANWIAVQCREAGVPFYYAGNWGALQRAVPCGAGGGSGELHPAEMRRRHLVGPGPAAIGPGVSGGEVPPNPPAQPWRPTKWFEFPAELDG